MVLSAYTFYVWILRSLFHVLHTFTRLIPLGLDSLSFYTQYTRLDFPLDHVRSAPLTCTFPICGPLRTFVWIVRLFDFTLISLPVAVLFVTFTFFGSRSATTR